MTIDAQVSAQQQILIDVANAAVKVVPSYVQTALTTAQGFSTANDPLQVTSTSIAIPRIVDPFANFSAELATQYGQIFNSLGPWLQQQVNGWLSAYFPTMNANLGPTIDTWIINQITNGGTGVPAAVENAIWERARARDIQEAGRMVDEVVMQFANRGFSLPPGALASRALKIQQDALDKASTLSRDVAIKSLDVEIENIRFAVAEGGKVRIGLVGAVVEFLRVIMLIPQTSVQYVSALAQAKQHIFEAAAAYYNALINNERLSIEAQVANQSAGVKVAEINVLAYGHRVDAQVNAAIAAAKVMGAEASAALTGINTLSASLSATTTQG